MGIKNNTWMLALLNPDLQGVDPHSPDLTQEQKVAIAVECKLNPWYFFREVAKAPASGGSEPVQIEANRGNMALWWCFFNHVTITLIQIRQTGKSFCTDVLQVLLMEMVCQNTQINLMTKDDTLRRANIERMKSIISDLPLYLNLKRYDDSNNTEEITVNALKNRYKTHVPQSSEKGAYKMGRGLTSAVFHVDEGPFQPNISIALPSALAATGAAIDSAKEAGTPYGTIFTTTAGKKDDKDGRYFYGIVCDGAPWTENFYDCANQHDLEAIVRQNSRSGEYLITATFNHTQLGKSDAWLASKLEGARARGDDANRDYFNMWTSGSQSSPLPVHILEIMARNIRDVDHTQICRPTNYIVRWYIPKNEIERRMANGKYVLGMDTSDAVGRDEISLVLTDIETLEVVAAASFNETNLLTFSDWLCSFMIQYPNITANIERRSSGAHILDSLILGFEKVGIDPFKRLFNWVVNDHMEHKERFREINMPMNRRPSNLSVKYKRLFGFATSGGGATSRKELYSTTLQNACKLMADRMNDKKLIDQTASLIMKNDRVDHPDGEHDDMTIGLLMGFWLLSQGTNLIHYGIDPSRVMCRVGRQETKSADELHEEEQQEMYRARIDLLFDQLTAEKDEYISNRLERELRVLSAKLIVENAETFSVDQMILNAREAKSSKVRLDRGRQVNQQSKYDMTSFARARQGEHGFFSDTPLNLAERYMRR